MSNIVFIANFQSFFFWAHLVFQYNYHLSTKISDITYLQLWKLQIKDQFSVDLPDYSKDIRKGLIQYTTREPVNIFSEI